MRQLNIPFRELSIRASGSRVDKILILRLAGKNLPKGKRREKMFHNNQEVKAAAIITHGDGDGIIAAAVAIMAGATGTLVITQPFLLHKLPDLQGPTVILDMAVDNRNPQATLDWCRRNAKQIVLWVGHHQGGEGIGGILWQASMYDPTAPSCPELMSQNGFDVPAEWLAAANACDRPAEYSPVPLSQRYNAAFKVSLISLQSSAPDAKGAVEKVQRGFIDELISGKENEFVSQNARAYPVLMALTTEATNRYKEVVIGVVVTEIDHQTSADITALLFAGYKLASVAVVQTISAEDGKPITIVATNVKDRDLVKAFGLGSGNTQRVTLVGGTHEEQLARVSYTAGQFWAAGK